MANTLSNDSRRNSSLYQLSHTGWTTADPVYLIPLFSSSELTGCGYPGLLDRKNCSDMCPRWESKHGARARRAPYPLGQALRDRTRGFPKALFIDLLVLVLHMVREIWRETDRNKAGKNFKVTEPKFSNVTALNGLAKFSCIIVLTALCKFMLPFAFSK